MTELDLYKFLSENEIETSRQGKYFTAWIPFYLLKDFTELIGYGMLDEGGLEVRLQEYNVAIQLNEVCDYFGFEPAHFEQLPLTTASNGKTSTE